MSKFKYCVNNYVKKKQITKTKIKINKCDKY